MNSTDLEVPAFFTTNGKDVWELGTYCMQPTCELKNLKTGDIESFGMGGLTAERFRKIKMPKVSSTVPIGVPEPPLRA